MITLEQLQGIYATQEEICITYTGEQWRDKTTLGQFFAATEEEFAEFLEETTELWKWYGVNLKLNRSEALIEFVDYIMFVLSSLNHQYAYENMMEGYDEDDSFDDDYDYDLGSVLATKIYLSHNMAMGENGSAFEDIADMIHSVCGLLLYTPEDFFKAFYFKCDLCKKRVAGGVLTGAYDKSTEPTFKA